jgi:1,3-beta-glucan synthase
LEGVRRCSSTESRSTRPGTLTVWGYWLLWFWVSLLALCISPFLFNPHQFAWADFFIDYREFLRWLSRGNTKAHSASWIGFVRLSRTRLTGFKRKALGEPSAKLSGDTPRAHFTNVFFSEIIGPLVFVAVTLIPYLFINSGAGVDPNAQQNQDVDTQPSNPLIRVGLVALAPIGINAGVAIGFFGSSPSLTGLFSLVMDAQTERCSGVVDNVEEGLVEDIVFLVLETNAGSNGIHRFLQFLRNIQ